MGQKNFGQLAVPITLALVVFATFRLPPSRPKPQDRAAPRLLERPLDEPLWVRYGEDGMYSEMARRAGIHLLITPYAQGELNMSEQQRKQLAALADGLKGEASAAWKKVDVPAFPFLEADGSIHSSDRAAKIARGEELLRRLAERWRVYVDDLLTTEQRKRRKKL